MRRTRDVVLGMVEDYIEAVERLQAGERGRHGLNVLSRYGLSRYAELVRRSTGCVASGLVRNRT